MGSGKREDVFEDFHGRTHTHSHTHTLSHKHTHTHTLTLTLTHVQKSLCHIISFNVLSLLLCHVTCKYVRTNGPAHG
jgi:hypothetical protein